MFDIQPKKNRFIATVEPSGRGAGGKSLTGGAASPPPSILGFKSHSGSYNAAAQTAAVLRKLLKTGAWISSLALPTVAFTGQAALAGKHNFEIYNDSSENIVEIYVTDSQIASWGKNLLGKMSIIPSGSSLQIAFGDPSEDVCLYDILTVFESGEMVEEYGVDVCYYDYYALLNE